MFEDLKEKIRQKQEQASPRPIEYSPEVLETLKKRGIDPDNVTLQQLFPETLDVEGNDLSLMSGAETEILVTYGQTRKCLLERYHLTQEEAKRQGQPWDEAPDELGQINIAKAKKDPLRRVFIKALNEISEIYDKIKVLQHEASEYEKFCLRVLLALNL
jgi:hypothetical protein